MEEALATPLEREVEDGGLAHGGTMRPMREVATRNEQTYFVTSNCAGRVTLFRHERWLELFVTTLVSYRPLRSALHSFTVMPDHFHVLITPVESLERAVQFIKSRFSFKATRELGWGGEFWVAGFSDHRIRHEKDCEVHVRYIERNAVKAGLVAEAGVYSYCSASERYELDELPRGLKPAYVGGRRGAAKAAPFQSGSGGVDAPFLSGSGGVADDAPFRDTGKSDFDKDWEE